MSAYVNGIAYTPTGGVSPAKIIEATENWLEENIDLATGYAVDSSLSIEGAAADAKATGDELADLKSAVDNIFEKGKNLYNKETNTIGQYVAWNNGVFYPNANYQTTDFIPLIPGEAYTASFCGHVAIYNVNKEYIGGFYIYTKSGQVNFAFSDTLGDSSSWMVSYTTPTEPYTIRCQTGWAYLRETIANYNADIFMVEQSDHYTGFEPYGERIDTFSANAKNAYNLGSILSCRTFSKIVKNPLNIKLIGDSITAGVGGTGYDASSSGGGELICNYAGGIYSNVSGKCWANSLKAYWEEKFDVSVKNFGWSGIATDDLITYWSQIIHTDDDVLICTIGTNDRADCANVTQFIDRLETLYTKSVADGKLLVLIAGIPASISNETNGTKNFHMEDVEHAIRYVTDKHNIPFVNLYSLFLKHCKYTGTTIDSYLSDGLHPNDSGYDVMFELITEAFGISPKRPGSTW